jgi:hypothetical protein
MVGGAMVGGAMVGSVKAVSGSARSARTRSAKGASMRGDQYLTWLGLTPGWTASGGTSQIQRLIITNELVKRGCGVLDPPGP